MKLAALVAAVALMAAEGDRPLVKPVKVSMVAVQAIRKPPSKDVEDVSDGLKKVDEKEKRVKRFGMGLDTVRPALEDLDFDEFRKVAVAKAMAKPGQEVRLAIDRRYTLYVKPLARDNKGRIRITARVEELVRKKPESKARRGIRRREKDKKLVHRQALSLTSAVARDKPLRLGGFKLDEGELVVILTVGE